MNLNEECLLRFLNNPERLINGIEEFEKTTIIANFEPEVQTFVKEIKTASLSA